MKLKKHLVALLTVIAIIASVVCMTACGDKNDNNAGTIYPEYTITVNADKSLNLQIGDTVDYKQYFTVKDSGGNQIVVMNEMLDLSEADTTKEGTFTVTLEIGDASKSITFTVSKKDDGNGGNGGNGGTGESEDLATILAKYTDSTKWNFATALEITDSDGGYDDYYEYNGNNVKYVWEEDGDQYTDYISYVPSTDKYYYYAEQGNGSYEKYEEGTDDFNDWFWYAAPVNLTEIKDFEFTDNNGVYTAKKPNDAGNTVIGEFTSITWTSFTLTVKNGNLATITAVMSDNSIYTYTFSKFGSITFTLPNVSGGTTPVTPTGTMDKQTYNAATFDNERLQDKITKTGDEPDPAIGLPSKGTYNALVIPVQFSGKTIDNSDLVDLNTAFNGDYEGTGWESVHSYYYKSSYGQLDISFDIARYNIVQQVPTFTAKYNYSYYESHKATEQGETYKDGDNLLLHEALKYYDSYIDFSDYDYNGDGTIDAVYLIYSAPVDYESDDSFYWAYVTWNYGDSQYDGKNVFYYLFAGLDFMIESVHGGYTNEYYPEIAGLKVNASTYIHETGHLLGLDDYYDYDENSGCNEGLGGADMMDATVGDQNVYSKTMLGWLTPQIVVSTQTVTIKSSQERGDAILIPLNFNNSYFCEYLLIDLYSASGLNAMHAKADNSYLYDGENYGVRIYHVSSSINNVYNSDYGSFTDNNNTDTNIALIKLIEADGHTKFSDSQGYAADSDLWKAGQTLSKVFPQYKTNAGKTLNFDISIDSVSATQATITITYAA
ncbi:MAG: hypothetical protein K2J01_02930 [Clostridiales bacterium]|nr:hypothetical protein [Clostridiales bacterium]